MFNSTHFGSAKPKEASLHMVVTRADGTVEDLGIVSYYSSNPLKMLLWNLRQLLKRIAK